MGALPEIWRCCKARGRRISFMDLRPTSNAAAAPKIGNPEGCFLASVWRRCSSVRERCGYLPSSRLASRSLENSAPIPYFDMGSKLKTAQLSPIMKISAIAIATVTALLANMPALAADSAAMPKVGDKAPLVEGKDQDGKPWKLSDDVGKKLVLLYFYPKDDTPGCTKEACGFRDNIEALKADNVEV